MSILFPKTLDSSYRGNKIPLYFFYLLTIVTIGRSLAHMFLEDGGAQSIATIPLDNYSVEASDVVIHIFSEWGLTQLMFGILYAIALWKYKTLIPLMYLFMIVEYSGRLFLTFYKPITLQGTAPGEILNYVMIPLALILLVLSLQKSKKNA